jgi:hypothetical protein
MKVGFAFLVALSLAGAISTAQAGYISEHWGRGLGGDNGKRIHEALVAPAQHYGQGPIAGRNGAAIHNNLMGAEKAIGKGTTDTRVAIGGALDEAWDVVRRPFVEFGKFISDPLAGPRRKADEFVNNAKIWIDHVLHDLLKWLTLGIGIIVAFAVALAMLMAGFFFGRRSHASA